MRGSPTWLALVGYRSEFGADVLTLRRSDGSFLAAFSARGTTLEIVLRDRGRAEEGLVELRSEEGELSYKHIEELSPEDRVDRIRAELARIEWLLERQGRRNIVLRWPQHGHPARSSEA